MITVEDTAILILTCNDFEAMEITVNQVLRTTPDSVRIYLLSNCAGLPGADICERMCSIAARAQYGRIVWINPGKRQPAWFGIRDAIRDHIAEAFIVKLDDDVFPVREGWLEDMIDCYARQDPARIAYVTGLVNNNPYGFSQLVQLPALAAAYAAAMPLRHVAGNFVPAYQDLRVSEAGAVDPGGWGTVWQFPQLARWIHKETTLQPDRFTEMTRDLTETRFDPTMRYSINVMLFHRDLWAEMGDGGTDDEQMVNLYSGKNDLDIIVRRDVPFVHLYFGPQKPFLIDMMRSIRDVYRPLNQIAGEEFVEDWQAFKLHWLHDKLK